MSGKITYGEGVLTLQSGISYDEGGSGFPGSGGAGVSTNNKKQELFLENLEQSHHFTIRIDKLEKYLPYYYKTSFKDPNYFLPVKSIRYTRASMGSTNFSVGVLGDLPILSKKGLGKISIIFYDNDKEVIERAILDWICECFPGSCYVNYLVNMVAEMEYVSYSVEGKINEQVSGNYAIIPSDSTALSRSYDENGAKLVELNALIVSSNYI